MQRHLSASRLATYMRASGSLDAGVEPYQRNAAVAGALREALGHVEVVLRNALHDSLWQRHQRLSLVGVV